jgi:hypothetical protein
MGSVCHVKQFIIGSRNSLKDIQKLQMMLDQVTLLRLRQKQLCKGWKILIQADRRIMIDSVVTALGCSHGVVHDHLKFWKVRMLGAQRTEGLRKINRIDLSLQHLLWYADEEKICLTGLYLGTNHGCITTNLNQSMIQWWQMFRS